MKNISIRSTFVLSVIGIISIGLFALVERTKKNRLEDWNQEKISASQLSKKAMDHLKNINIKDQVFIDNINDPNESGLIGVEYTPITTGTGSLPIKLATTNPNFAAVIVQLLKEAGLKEGDCVAMCMTGSFPAMNISALAALQTLKIKPIIITSITASSWGANDPENTWVDMESELNSCGILKNKSIASSIGGNMDVGRALSLEGRQMVKDAIFRNNIPYLNTGSLYGNTQKRMQIFKEKSPKPIKAFINIGGGVASIGSDANGEEIDQGANLEVKLKDFTDKKGVMFEMAKKGLPIINLLHFEKLLEKYNLPLEVTPIPEIGKGKIYKSIKYQIPIVSLSLTILIALLLIIVYADKKQHALGNEIIKTNN